MKSLGIKIVSTAAVAVFLFMPGLNLIFSFEREGMGEAVIGSLLMLLGAFAIGYVWWPGNGQS